MTSLPQSHVRWAAALGLLAFVLLAVRFSPDWIEYQHEFQAATALATDDAQRTAVANAFDTSVAAARGTHVARQVADLSASTDDRNHNIVRWRLFFPVIGHLLGLPPSVALGLAHVGCLLLVSTLVWVGLRNAGSSVAARIDAACLAIVTGATAPFFTSMGWLGYYDAWLALALIAIAFVRTRFVVLVACAAGPWIDERLVLALPLALGVRWAHFQPTTSGALSWFRREAVPPIVLTLGFVAIRLALGGTGGSTTVADYLREFVLARQFDAARMFRGSWEGLRCGWILVAFVALGCVRAGRGRHPIFFPLLAVCGLTLLSLALGLLTALDISRSMVLLLPVVPLGWSLARRESWWTRYRLPPVLALVALLAPATHVVSRFIMPVDNLWSPPLGALQAFNNLGVACRNGAGMPKSDTAAVQWFRRAGEHGLPAAQTNLGLSYEHGLGVEKNPAEALRWYLRAVRYGDSEAQAHLGAMYAGGVGVPVDDHEAIKWLRRAALQGHATAQANLGTMYALGRAVPKDPAAAAKWYLRAAAQHNAIAEACLGEFYSSGTGVPRDPKLAAHWILRAAYQGHVRAQGNLGTLYIRGEGVPQNPLEALAWFHLATANGDAAFVLRRDQLEMQLTPQEVAAARQRAGELAAVIRPGYEPPVRPTTPL